MHLRCFKLFEDISIVSLFDGKDSPLQCWRPTSWNLASVIICALGYDIVQNFGVSTVGTSSSSCGNHTVHADSFCETFRLSDLTDSLRQGLRARHFTHSEGRWTQANSWQTWSTLHFLVENIHPQVVPKWYKLILYKFLCVCLFIHCCSIYLGQYYESFWTMSNVWDHCS